MEDDLVRSIREALNVIESELDGPEGAGMPAGAEAADAVRKDDILALLETALADEFLAFYQYWVCKHLVKGPGRSDVTPELGAHAWEELDHAEKLIERIKQLGGEPITSPVKWIEKGNPWREPATSDALEQLAILTEAERDAIDHYQRIVDASAGRDEVTRNMAIEIMADEAEHKYDLDKLIEELAGEAGI